VTEADQMVSVAQARAADLARAKLTAAPTRRVAILACMDARIDLFTLLGLAPGDAHIIRNAGGLVTDDALRSLSVSQRLLGTQEIVVVMHRGCGLDGASDADFAAQLASDGAQPGWRLGSFVDVEQALREGLERLRSSRELIARELIRGFIYDPDTGALEEPAGR
jgi:carbonic anhydrase